MYSRTRSFATSILTASAGERAQGSLTHFRGMRTHFGLRVPREVEETRLVAAE